MVQTDGAGEFPTAIGEGHGGLHGVRTGHLCRHRPHGQPGGTGDVYIAGEGLECKGSEYPPDGMEGSAPDQSLHGCA